MRSRTTDKDLASILAEAARLVEDLPKDLRAAAFAKAVDLLISLRVSASTAPKPGVPPSLGTTTLNRLELDSTSYPEIYERKKVLDQALFVLRAVRDGSDSEWLSPTEIASILKEKFRIAANSGAVRMALARAGRYVDRRRVGANFEYRLMAGGDRYLDSPTTTKPLPAPRSSTSRPAASSPPRPTRQTKGPQQPGKRAGGSSPGPTRLVEQLVVEGFFESARTIGEIIDHLIHKKARRYASTDMSPVLTRLTRAGVLDRERNDEGQYVYRHRQGSKGARDAFLEGIMRRRDEQ